MDIGLLLVRVTVGLLMAAHGAQKLLGWFGGPGLARAAGLFEGLGFRPGRFFAASERSRGSDGAHLGQTCSQPSRGIPS